MAAHSYQISVDEQNRLVHLVVRGEVSKAEGEQVILAARAKAAETGLDICCDIREAEILARPADWFYLFRNKEIYPKNPAERTAILVAPEKRGMYTFVANVVRNLRLRIRVFVDEEKALAWLKQDPT